MNTQLAQHPWYRQPWPWLLMAGPAVVVVAGIFTTYLAVVSNDGVVADDYYKRGLAINQELSRDALAQRLNLRARVALAGDPGRVTVAVSGDLPATATLVLRLAHPLRRSLDRSVVLAHTPDGGYTALLPALAPGRWQLTLEDAARTWRLVGDVRVPVQAEVELAAR
jgi:hypothetical protein